MTTPDDGIAESNAERLERFHEFRRTGSRDLRNSLIEEHRGLADYFARQYGSRGEPLDDLRQVALVGLLKAVERFEPERGLSFATFAGPTIIGELKRYFRDRTWSVRVPRRLQELSLGIARARDELSQRLGRSPTPAEIASHAGVTEEQILEGMEAATLYRVGSLDVAVTERDESPVSDRVGELDEDFNTVDNRALVRDILTTLPARERQIVYLRFFEGLTQAEIAERVGVSQMHVSRLLTQSLETLSGQIKDRRVREGI